MLLRHLTQICRAVHFVTGGGDRGGDGRKGCWEEQWLLGVESTALFAKSPSRKISYLPRRLTESVTARR